MMQTLPKYRIIADTISKKIQQGTLQPGMRIPSENEIMETHHVSNTTARKALQLLEHSGWAKRIKGKGTFVETRQVFRRANKILSFTKNMLQAGYSPTTRVLEAELLKTGFEKIIGGRRYTMPAPVYRIKRLRFGNGTPMLLETRYISAELCPALMETDLTGSLYDLYWNNYGLELTEIVQTLLPVLVDSETNRYFELDLPAPALQVEGATFCGKEIILEMDESVYRGDVYSFTVSAVGFAEEAESQI